MRLVVTLSVLIGLLTLPLLNATAPDTGALTGDYLKLQGRWLVVKSEVKGADVPAMRGQILNFDGKNFRLNTDEGSEGYSLDESTSPRSVTFDDGHSPPIKGIYKLEGDTLIICMGEPGAQRPKEFKSDTSTGAILTQATRAK